MTPETDMPGLLSPLTGALPQGEGAQAMAILFALVLGVSLGLAIASLAFGLHLGRQRRRARRHPARPAAPAPHWSRQHRWTPPPWAGLCQWLAIRDSHPHLVQAALRLHNPTPCSWEEGLSVAQERMLFISPPLAGWTLVMGGSLPDPGGDVDGAFHFLRQLSAKLGEVQFFSFERARQYHAWVRAGQGEIGRAYAWAGRTVWNQGAVTAAERELGLRCYAYGEGPGRILCEQASPLVLNTERVPLLAARWSVNPTAIDLRLVRNGHGIAGRLSPLR